MLPNLTAMFEAGLYINDLSLHDNSKDLVLAGTQTSAELKLALDQVRAQTRAGLGHRANGKLTSRAVSRFSSLLHIFATILLQFCCCITGTSEKQEVRGKHEEIRQAEFPPVCVFDFLSRINENLVRLFQTRKCVALTNCCIK